MEFPPQTQREKEGWEADFVHKSSEGGVGEN